MNYRLSNHLLSQTAKQIFIAVVLLCGLSTSAQDGSLDTTFNSTGPQPGVVSTPIGSGNADNNAVAIQADGNIITAGAANDSFALARYTIAGSLDTSFGVGGIVITSIGTSSVVNALAIQPDTNIIAAGATITDGLGSFALARYLSDGSLDASFGTGGIVTTAVGSNQNTAIYAVALQVDGKIVVAGTDNSTFVLTRYLVNGSLDTSFGVDGIVTTAITGSSPSIAAFGVAIQVDNSIVAVGTEGTNFVLVRYMPDGSLDTSFGTGGIVVTSIGTKSIANAVAIQADGKIVAAGLTFPGGGVQNYALARYLSNGALDTSFGVDGIVTTTLPNTQFFAANAVTLQSDGKIIGAGIFTDNITHIHQFSLARYLPDGSLDTTFGTGGVVITSMGDDAIVFAIALQKDGKIIAAGGTNFDGLNEFVLARYLVDPVLFPTVITSVTPTGPLKTIQLSGTAQNESIVTIILDGVATNFAVTTPLDSSADETNTTGTWSVNIGTLTPGLHTIVASASYKTGNIIIVSNPIQIRFRLSSPCGFITC
jgi:uncharacterized delta-60 repeat protein